MAIFSFEDINSLNLDFLCKIISLKIRRFHLSPKIFAELDSIKDKKIWRKKYNEYAKKGLVGITKRLELGNLGKGRPNGLFLYDDDGKMRAMFCIDSENSVRLEMFDQKGNKVSSWPTKK